MSAKLKVAVSDFSPLVIEKNGSFSGFEIDIWEEIARLNKFDFEYSKEDFQSIIPNLAKRNTDVGIRGITITEKREEIIDFSHPTLNSGLLILVLKNRNKFNFVGSLRSFFEEASKIVVTPFLIVSCFMLIFAHLLYFAEWPANTFTHHYIPGIFESLWLIICSISTDSFGDFVPHTWAGRIVISGVIIFGVVLWGILVAQITAFLAVKKIKGQINDCHDLSGKRVATIKDSTSEEPLEKLGARVISLSKIEDACQALKSGRVDAVVFDAPVITYIAENQSDKGSHLEIVGDLFERQEYGIGLQQGSKLRETINRSLLKIKEDGTYNKLYQKWFGENSTLET